MSVQAILLGKQDTITTSTRTLLNGVLFGSDGTMDVIARDSAPTANSTNLVTSGGVFVALADKAPVSHASSATTYGKGDDTNYGHLKLSDAVNSTSGTSSGIAATPSAVKSAYDLASGKAPTSHASSATTYGKGDSSNYGHLKLSDATDSSSSTSGGIAATPAAVKSAYDLAASKQSALTFDSTPTDGSSNPVTSDGIYDAIAAVKGAGQVKEIPDSSDLNAYTTPGWYAVQSSSHAATITNAPISNSGFMLIVTKRGENTTIRAQFAYTHTRIYLRTYANSTWSDWIEFQSVPINHASSATTYGKGDNTNYGHLKLSDAILGSAADVDAGIAATPFAVYSVKGFAQSTALSKNDDLNNYKDAGVYTVQNSDIAETITNAPTTATGFSLLVIRRTSKAITQVAFGMKTLYIRTASADDNNVWTWHAWNSPEGLDHYAGIANGTDLDDLTDSKWYKCAYANVSSLVHAPWTSATAPSVGFGMFSLAISSEGYPVQVIFVPPTHNTNIGGTIYIRYKHSGGTWSNWKRFGNDDDKSEYVGAISAGGSKTYSFSDSELGDVLTIFGSEGSQFNIYRVSTSLGLSEIKKASAGLAVSVSGYDITITNNASANRVATLVLMRGQHLPVLST